MNVIITLEKQLSTSNPKVCINGDTVELVDTVTRVELDITTPAMIIVARYDDSIYSTENVCLDNCVYVRHISIDHFWEIKEHNHLGVTEFDPEFLAHLQKLNHPIDDFTNNNALFFNGRIVYNIPSTVRKMFFV